MSQVPARLVYTDSGGTEQVIGAFQPSDPTDGNISTFTVEEDALNYKRVIIEGGPTLQNSMPSDLSEFQGDEPEIRAEVDSNLDGNWETRARVYPEVEGTTNNRGQYKNKNLWGFKKYHGEADIETGTITTNLTDVLDALLPSGYTARYPGDITPPNVDNYTFSGSRQQAFREIQRYYNHFIIFTTETDGSGNYYVDLQPQGYGSVQFSLTRGQDGYTYNYWKKADTSNVVSKVKVIGKNTDNEEIERVIAAGSNTGVHGDDTDVDVYLGSPEPARKKFRRVHVDYTITESEADSIGENVVEPEAIEQGEIEHELNIESTLNQSVGIVDDNRTPENPIDDVFTVVKQKDFIHQGVTQYSFEFEKEATQKQVDKWTEHDFERASVYPRQPENVGEQNFTGDTGSAPSDTQRDPNTGLDDDRQGEQIGSSRFIVKDDTNVAGAEADAITFSGQVPTSPAVNQTQNGDTIAVWDGITVTISVSNWGGGTIPDMNYEINNTSTATTVASDTGISISDEETINIWWYFGPSTFGDSDVVEVKIWDDSGLGIDFYSDPNKPFFTTVDVKVQSKSQHLIGDDIDTEDFQHGGTMDVTGQHGTSGTTDETNVNITTEDKTDR